MMTKDHAKPTWVFYLGWVAVSVISIPLAFAITMVILKQVIAVVGGTIEVGGVTHITEDFLVMYILLPVIGLLAGLLQYFLLRGYLPRMEWWTAATFLGWLLAFIPLQVLYVAFAPALKGDVRWAVPLAGALLGVSMALPQWVLLHRRIDHAAGWILASGIGWALGLFFTDGAISSTLEELSVLFLPPVVASVGWWLLLAGAPTRTSPTIGSIG